MRSEIKAALAAWNPAWAAKVSYACEPPTAGQAPCGTGCQFCKAGAVGDCVPENVNCATIDALPTFAARCRRVLRGVGKEEEEAVQGEARGQLRLPEEGEAVPRHAAERGRLLELRQEEALQARRGCMWSGSKKKGSCAQV